MVRRFWLGVLVVVSFSALEGLAQQEYLLPQVADSSAIRTTFVLFNPTSGTVTVNIKLTGDSGGPLVFDLANLGKKSQFDLSLPAGATRILQSNGTGDGAPGAARVTASSPIGVSSIFSLFDASKVFLTETGIGDSKASSSFVLPVDVSSDFNTGVALFNPSTQAASLNLVLTGTNGQVIAQTSTPVSVPALGHLAKFVTEFFPSVTTAKGALKITSTQSVAALTLRQNVRKLNLTSLPVVPTSSTQTSFILPHVADGPFTGGAIKMSFLLFNVSNAQANVDLKLTNDAGQPFVATIDGVTDDQFAFQLAPGGARFVATDGSAGGSNQLTTGAAVVTSNQPIGVSGIFTLVDAQGAFLTETGIGDSPVQAASTVAVDVTGSTGIAFFNPGTQQVTLQLKLWNSEGGQAAKEASGEVETAVASAVATNETTVTLRPKEHVAKFVNELFGGTPTGIGSVAITGNAATLTLRQIVSPRLSFTAFPVGSGAYGGVSGPTDGPPLPKTISNVTATSNQTLNVSLPAGFKLSGEVNNPAPIPMLMTVNAVKSDGQQFSTTVNLIDNSYELALPAGSYNLNVCSIDFGSGLNYGFQYDDPASITVNADSTRNLNLPGGATHQVNGTVSGREKLPAGAQTWVLLQTADGKKSSWTPVTPQGTFSASALDGQYGAGLIHWLDENATQAVGMPGVGNATVAGSDVFNRVFTVPDLVKVTGDVRNQNGSPLSGAFVTAFNTAETIPFSCSGLSAVFSYVGVNSPYEIHLVKSRPYSLQAVETVIPESTLQSTGDLVVPVPGRSLNLSANKSGEDFIFPNLPPTVTISGRVTDVKGQPVSDATVTAYSQSLTNTPNASFGRSAQTDSNGNYTLTILSGVSYTITFTPPVSGFSLPF